MKENKKDTQKKPAPKQERDTSKDLAIMTAMILRELEKVNTYLKFMAENEAMRTGRRLE